LPGEDLRYYIHPTATCSVKPCRTVTVSVQSLTNPKKADILPYAEALPSPVKDIQNKSTLSTKETFPEEYVGSRRRPGDAYAVAAGRGIPRTGRYLHRASAGHEAK